MRAPEAPERGRPPAERPRPVSRRATSRAPRGCCRARARAARTRQPDPAPRARPRPRSRARGTARRAVAAARRAVPRPRAARARARERSRASTRARPRPRRRCAGGSTRRAPPGRESSPALESSERPQVGERAAAREDGERLVQLPLAVAEQVVAPLECRAAACAGARAGRPALPSRARAPRSSASRTWAGGSTTSRDATSSIASGSPSRRRQISSIERDRVLAEHDAAGGGELREELRRVGDRERGEWHHVLGRETERDAARHEHLHVGCGVEQLAHVARRLPAGARGCRGAAARRSRRAPRRRSRAAVRPGRLAHADRARDRGRDELGVRDRREPDEMDGPVHGGGSRDLEREAALPRPAGPGDGHEPHVGAREQAPARRRGRRPGRRAGGGAWAASRRRACAAAGIRRRARRPTSWKSGCGSGTSFSRWRPSGLNVTAGQRLLARELAGRLRDDDLVAVAGAADARRHVDVEADVALGVELGLAGVDPDAHAQRRLPAATPRRRARAGARRPPRPRRARPRTTRNAPSPAQSTSWPFQRAADSRTSSRSRARTGP